MGSAPAPERRKIVFLSGTRADFGKLKSLILAYHPVTTSLGTLRAEVRELTTAVLESGRDWVVIYPNKDEGSALILHPPGCSP